MFASAYIISNPLTNREREDIILNMNRFWSKFKGFFGKQDLTQGSPIKGILVFLIPIFFSTIFQQFYTLTDAAIVGQALPQEAVAAVNASGSVNFIVLNFGMGCATGFSVLLSRAVGAKNVIEAKRSYATQIILGLFVAAIMAIAGIALIPAFLRMLGIVQGSGSIAMEIEYNEAKTYMTYLFAASGLVFFYNLAVANLRAKGDSFAPFCFLALSVSINIGLDFLFIYAFQMGVAGSALATVISQGIACLIATVYGAKKYEEMRIDWKQARPTGKGFLEHIKNGIPLGFQYSVLGFGIIAMTAGVLSFDVYADGSTVPGLPAQLGYGAACKIINFLLAPLGALGTAMVSYFSQNYGAKNIKRIKRGFIAAVQIGIVLTLLVSLIGLILMINGAYQYLFLSRDKISERSIFYGNAYLWISIPTLFFLTMLFIFRGVLQGLEKSMFAMMAGFVELFARIFVCAVLPKLIYGSLTAESPDFAYYIVASGDWFAWLMGGLAMCIPSVIYLKKLIAKYPEQE